jgi:hypothetical protein
MNIDIRDPSVDPNYLFYDFVLWLNTWQHYKVSSQIHSWNLKEKVGLWADLSDNDKEINALLYCWVRLGFLEAFGFDGAHAPYIYVFKKVG